MPKVATVRPTTRLGTARSAGSRTAATLLVSSLLLTACGPESSDEPDPAPPTIEMPGLETSGTPDDEAAAVDADAGDVTTGDTIDGGTADGAAAGGGAPEDSAPADGARDGDTRDADAADAGGDDEVATPVLPPPAALPDGVDASPASRALMRAKQAVEGMDRFAASLVFVVEDGFTGDRVMRVGDVFYERSEAGADAEPGAGAGAEAGDDADAAAPSSLAIVFEATIVDGRRRDRRRAYILQGRWFVERDDTERIFVKRSIAPPGQAIDPFRLGDGPFPLPIGQDPAAVLARFDCTIIEVPTEGILAELDEAAVEGVRLVPRDDRPSPGRDGLDELAHIDLFYDRVTGIPVGVSMVELTERIQTARLDDVARNPDFDASVRETLDITPPAADSGWSVEIR